MVAASESSNLRKRTNKKWDDRFQELVEFHREHGHTDVPRSDQRYTRLTNWMDNSLRRSVGRSKLTEDQIQRVTALGFVFLEKSHSNKVWDEHFAQLKAYKAAHGHFNVSLSASGGDHDALARWISAQRAAFANGTLKADRVEKLGRIGLPLKAKPATLKATTSTTSSKHYEEQWNASFRDLQAFVKKNGHAIVQKSKDPKLGRWVAKQREHDKNGTLTEEHRSKLDSVGFVWQVDVRDAKRSVNQKKWDSMFERLIEYHQEYGTFHIHAQDDIKLVDWAGNQLQHFRNGTLGAEREARLREVGFFDKRRSSIYSYDSSKPKKKTTTKRKANREEARDDAPGNGGSATTANSDQTTAKRQRV